MKGTKTICEILHRTKEMHYERGTNEIETTNWLEIMKVKIGNMVYDPNETPIMVILTKEDKSNIANMHPDAIKYVAFPDTMSVECVEEWMHSPCLRQD